MRTYFWATIYYKYHDTNRDTKKFNEWIQGSIVLLSELIQKKVIIGIILYVKMHYLNWRIKERKAMNKSFIHNKISWFTKIDTK